MDPCRAMEDWQKARDWLKNEKLTKATVKVHNFCLFVCRHTRIPCQVPNLHNISTEFELYTYLKDGTELCRAIGLATQGRVLSGIFYR